MVDITKLPKAKSGFEELRSQNQIYVDHTDLIYEFAYLDGPNFLSRPRRFGKSLLISTLESLFSHGTEFFKGLKIEKLWEKREQGKTYKVIHLDFSSFAYISPVDFDTKIYDTLANTANCLEITQKNYSGTYKSDALLTDIISSAPGEFVLLIDEYDYPLTHSLDDKELFEEYRKYIQGLFGTIKALSGKMRFIFITGVGRFAKTSVFSQLNNLRDLGLEAKFAPLLGYTEADMHQYFDEYVENAANILKLSKEECYAQIKAHYDGYRFHVNNETLLHNPWSVLNFLSAPENGFKNFWYETGGAYPTLIANYIENIQQVPLESIQKTEIGSDELSNFFDYFTVTPLSILYQTGYLSLRVEENALGGQSLFLVPPNLEVKSALSKLYLKKVRQTPITEDDEDTASALVSDFNNQSYENLIKHFNVILNSFGYDNKVAFTDERNCRDFIELAMTVAGINSRKEVISSIGSADLVVEMPGKRYVFEFKLARTKGSEALLLDEALEHSCDKRYGEILPIKELIRIGVVISAKDNAVSLWKIF
ncbi:AAA family ATPase [Succinivibrio dextrinosolvens]|uniref:PD-(D/E)XK nuclease superfamily protein n=1 Tax=Succinivibrio dextrinosolvens TaxID=83771 RepID=A0A662ZA90_9GAMM|nr:AAA family ATPase [Succinivibrio dextrinosolvens]SFK07276.1 PD-(D/E)XK nuclease superfamily protein [Succinivibrio dextrinosolvens]